MLSLVPLLLACLLDVQKLQEGGKSAAEEELVWPNVQSEAAPPPAAADHSTDPHAVTSTDAGHHVWDMEAGVAHTEADLTAGLLIEGDQLAALGSAHAPPRSTQPDET